MSDKFGAFILGVIALFALAAAFTIGDKAACQSIAHQAKAASKPEVEIFVNSAEACQ